VEIGERKIKSQLKLAKKIREFKHLLKWLKGERGRNTGNDPSSGTLERGEENRAVKGLVRAAGRRENRHA